MFQPVEPSYCQDSYQPIQVDEVESHGHSLEYSLACSQEVVVVVAWVIAGVMVKVFQVGVMEIVLQGRNDSATSMAKWDFGLVELANIHRVNDTRIVGSFTTEGWKIVVVQNYTDSYKYYKMQRNLDSYLRVFLTMSSPELESRLVQPLHWCPGRLLSTLLKMGMNIQNGYAHKTYSL